MDINDSYGSSRPALPFSLQEANCEKVFLKYPEYYHLSTSENFPLLFKSEADYQAAMTIIGIVARLHPGVTIFTFEWMSNHLHLVAAATQSDIQAFFADLRNLLFRYLHSVDHSFVQKEWNASLRRITSLEDLRNAIIYDNRNAYVVNPEVTPFSYKWGANRFIFLEDAALRCKNEGRPLKVKEIRSLVKTHKADGAAGLTMVDGYVSPATFCAITETEQLFRSAQHYFTKLSKDVESQGKIASELGEKIYYVDDELYVVLCKICRKQYQQASPTLLDKTAKISVAKTMHYDYNASNKQISRMLKLDIAVVDALFPTRSR